MLLSLILTFASLDPSLQVQAQTHVTKTADKAADHLGRRFATLENRVHVQAERIKVQTKLLKENNLKLHALQLESQRLLRVAD